MTKDAMPSCSARAQKRAILPLARALGLMLAVGGLCPSGASAAGFALPGIGPSNTGVSTTGPTSVHYNPAGLGFATTHRVLIGGNLVVGDLRYRRQRLATYQREDSLDFSLPVADDAIDPSKTGAAHTVKTSPVGLLPAVFAEMPVPSLPLAVGFGIDAPYAAIVRWPGLGPQRFQLDDATLATVFFNAGIAYKPHPRLSFGAGFAYVAGFANLSRIQDLGAVSELGKALARPPISQPNGFGPNANPALRELDTLGRPFTFNNGLASGATFRLGVMGEAAKNLWLSASYEHSTQLNFRGTFTLDMNNPFFTQDLASQGLQYPALVRGKSSLTITLPKVVRLGARYGFGGKRGAGQLLEGAIEGTYTAWSSVKDFDVRVRSSGLAQPALGLGDSLRILLPRHWRDTVAVIGRGTLRPNEVLSLWASIGGESSASPDSTVDASSPDGTRVLAAAGLSRQLVPNLTLLLDLQMQSILKRHVTTSDNDLGNGSYVFRLFTGGAYLDYGF